jgi:hypothetical protein
MRAQSGKDFKRIGVDSPISETRHLKDIRQIIGSVSFHVLWGFSDPLRRLCKQVCIQLVSTCLDWSMYQKVVCSGLFKTKYTLGRQKDTRWGQVVSVLDQLSITPLRRMGGWRYSSTLLDLGTRWSWVVSFTLWLLYTTGQELFVSIG